MTKEQLFESMQSLDDDILEASERLRAARPAWVRWAVAAACVCIVAGAAWAAETSTHRLLPAAEQRAAVMPVPAPDWSAEPQGEDEYRYGLAIEWGPLPEKGTPPEDGAGEAEILTPGMDGYISPEPTPDLPATEDGLLPERQKPNSGEAWRPPLPASASDLDAEQPLPAPLPEPTPMPSGAPGPWTNGVYLPQESGGEAVCGYPPLISSYDAGEAASAACYATPANGEVGYSIPLRGAMEEYGGGAWYRVVVELFRDGRQLAPDGPEAEAERERLAALGYIVAYETYFDGEREHPYFTLHAYYENLENFAAGADYGYMLFLYDERVN